MGMELRVNGDSLAHHVSLLGVFHEVSFSPVLPGCATLAPSDPTLDTPTQRKFNSYPHNSPAWIPICGDSPQSFTDQADGGLVVVNT